MRLGRQALGVGQGLPFRHWPSVRVGHDGREVLPAQVLYPAAKQRGHSRCCRGRKARERGEGLKHPGRSQQDDRGTRDDAENGQDQPRGAVRRRRAVAVQVGIGAHGLLPPVLRRVDELLGTPWQPAPVAHVPEVPGRIREPRLVAPVEPAGAVCLPSLKLHPPKPGKELLAPIRRPRFGGVAVPSQRPLTDEAVPAQALHGMVGALQVLLFVRDWVAETHAEVDMNVLHHVLKVREGVS
mmetsp:Transcript_17278/g.40530  ORF Transcript_17278/g.40530 Transcript_17278/m.40530 type:complete len:240 (+) Transcript_17278:121-840(+)